MLVVWVLAVIAHTLCAQTLSEVPFRTVEAFWSFRDGLDDWAPSSTATMEAEVNVDDGLLHGSVLGGAAFIDSPLLEVDVDDRHYIVVRMAYDGSCNLGSVVLERGSPVSTFTNRKAPFKDPVTMTFPTTSDGKQHVYYVPIYTQTQETITRIRLVPCARGAREGQSFNVDWIMLAKAPTITKVRGCIDQYSATRGSPPAANVSLVMTKTNGVHPVFATRFGPLSLPYATTYNCFPNDTVTIQGRNFGDAALVRINGRPCAEPHAQAPMLARDAFQEELLTCTLPLNPSGTPLVVTVINDAYRGLRFDGPMVAYAQPINLTAAPTLSNVAAHAIDVTWAPPGDLWQSLATTGYLVAWSSSSGAGSFVVGNVTTTTLQPLAANTTYNVTVTAIVENQRTAPWQAVDMYGRRAMDGSGIVGLPSPVAGPSVKTLLHDFEFSSFPARVILNNSATYPYTTLGPTGDAGGQGAFGLVLLGHANVPGLAMSTRADLPQVENCNDTSVCCDSTANGTCQLTCAALPARASPTASLTGIRNSSAVAVPVALPSLPACGPALRLTGSAPFLTGAAWYPRPQTVREGFATMFTFRISNPSFHCKFMDDVATYCRSRGGDGFAFVLQNVDETVIGRGGSGLGYDGLLNALSIEFDTCRYNPELLDAYENHVSVHTRGAATAASAHHSFSLGATTQVPDLTDGVHTVTIQYLPTLTPAMVFANHFQPSAYISQLFASSTMDWSTIGVGCLSVEVDGLVVLSVPIHLDATLQLTAGRAFVGFTAATGADTWQVHDVLSWAFDSWRLI
ncbi:hypothetical protein ACHHYP_15408 [Achlya hypogyna]|uniref:Fibronectin type-III domain-containing protein n=1 Tax=Achlya hypogyna TaxID=1202772 RepID=A0A1V9ZF18_ACHHY|nr:hypothetical protein ACHHYP_15408 [Achlya hypogyna]